MSFHPGCEFCKSGYGYSSEGFLTHCYKLEWRNRLSVWFDIDHVIVNSIRIVDKNSIEYSNNKKLHSRSPVVVTIGCCASVGLAFMSNR